MTPTQPLMTVEDYFTKTPYTLRPVELIHGVLRAADSPSSRHQSAVFQLALALHAHVEERKLGRVWVSPLDVVLSERDALILQPDLFFVSNEREWIVGERVRGAPDLTIEVLSPRPRIGQVDERVEWFSEYGVRECWLVHQDDRTITVVDCETGADARTTFARNEAVVSRILPDWRLSLDEILDVRK